MKKNNANEVSETAFDKKRCRRFNPRKEVCRPTKNILSTAPSESSASKPEGENLMYDKTPHLIFKARPFVRFTL
ncbi:MAG: hypothetical protein CRN43_11070 [Candidatus Nephrothrix sp. EaCA]|nr:MAG: hypothetical protein CRN43_11070 [Candidatus Nephrothrix sp. EaCA]